MPNELLGPAGTTDTTVEVTSTRTPPSTTDVLTGRTPAVTETHPRPVAPLQLADEPRMESYELTAPDGAIVEITRNIDTGAHSTVWRTRRAWALPPVDPAS